MPNIKQFLSRRYMRHVDNLSDAFLQTPCTDLDWKTQRLLEVMEQVTSQLIYMHVGI